MTALFGTAIQEIFQGDTDTSTTALKPGTLFPRRDYHKTITPPSFPIPRSDPPIHITLPQAFNIASKIRNMDPNILHTKTDLFFDPRTSPAAFIWTLTLLSVGLILFRSLRSMQNLQLSSHLDARLASATAARYHPLWNTRNWPVLSLVCDQWFRGILPGNGMWTAPNAASLRAKRDKSALRKLVRMGIYPLYIQDGGGPTTAMLREGRVTAWGWVRWPLWKQSKRRAVFEFVVPRGRGWSVEGEEGMGMEERARRREDAGYLELVRILVKSRRLRRAVRWRAAATGVVPVRGEDALEDLLVTSKFAPDPKVPIEVGATSWFRILLLFKFDRVLRRGWVQRTMLSVQNWLDQGFLLSAIQLPIVRIEAPDDDEIELDKEVLLIAQTLGLDKGQWDEQLAKDDLEEEYFENNLEWVE